MVELGGVPDGPAALNIEINICKDYVDINIKRMNIRKSSFLSSTVI